jgi:hypothetical protein
MTSDKALSSVVAYVTPTHGVIESNPGEVKILFFHAVTMLLFYIIQRIIIPMFYIFQKSKQYITAWPYCKWR